MELKIIKTKKLGLEIYIAQALDMQGKIAQQTTFLSEGYCQVWFNGLFRKTYS